MLHSSYRRQVLLFLPVVLWLLMLPLFIAIPNHFLTPWTLIRRALMKAEMNDRVLPICFCPLVLAPILVSAVGLLFWKLRSFAQKSCSTLTGILLVTKREKKTRTLRV